MPSYSCPLAESHPGPWGLQEAGKQVEGCRLQRGKEKYTLQAYILISPTDFVCLFMCVPAHACGCSHVCLLMCVHKYVGVRG